MKEFVTRHIYKIAYLIFFAAVALRLAGFEAEIAKDRKAAEKYSGVTVSCTVNSVPQRANDTASFFAKCHGDLSTNILVKINHAKNLELTIGDRLTLTGVISLPKAPLNPGGFDYGSYMKSKGASVILETDIVQIKSHKESSLKPLYGIRSKVSEKILTYISADEAGLVNALVTGSKSEMSGQRMESFRRAGVYHIIAVSGLHLGMLLLFLSVFYTSFGLKRRFKRPVSLIFTLLGCGFLLIFTGFGISVQRAAVMALLLSVAFVMLREYSPFVSLFAVLGIVLLFEPGAYLDISAQLSFGATFGVLVGVRFLKRCNLRKNKFRTLIEAGVITGFANIFTLPFIVHHFGYVSLVGLISNPIILIFVPMLLLLSYIFAGVSLIAPVFWCRVAAGLAAAPAYAVNFLTDLFAGLPFSYVAVHPALVILLGFESICIAGFVKLKNRKLKYAILSLFVVANVGFVSYNTLREEVTVSFINVGQGDCTLIKSSDGSAFMIDCGSETEYNIAENEIVPYLNRQGIRKIDILFITHFHDDHTNGILPLMEQGFVKKLAVPARILCSDEKENADAIYSAAARYDIPIYFSQKGDTLAYRKNHLFEIIHPVASCKTDSNNGSMVVNYTYQGASVLFCSDIEGKAQHTIQNDLEHCDIMKVAHHGAYSSMSDMIYSKTTPDYAVISCGKDNIYSHPSKETLGAFKNSRIHRTDVSGPAVFKIRKGKVTQWRPN